MRKERGAKIAKAILMKKNQLGRSFYPTSKLCDIAEEGT